MDDLYLLGGIPVDRVAYRVMARGEHFETRKRITQVVFDAPPPAVSLRRGYREKQPEDLRGHRLGRLVVVSYWGRAGKGGKGAEAQKWVCRCVCGVYVIRTAKTIKLVRDPDDKCDHCRQLAYLQKQDRFMQTGRYAD